MGSSDIEKLGSYIAGSRRPNFGGSREQGTPPSRVSPLVKNTMGRKVKYYMIALTVCHKIITPQICQISKKIPCDYCLDMNFTVLFFLPFDLLMTLNVLRLGEYSEISILH